MSREFMFMDSYPEDHEGEEVFVPYAGEPAIPFVSDGTEPESAPKPFRQKYLILKMEMPEPNPDDYLGERSPGDMHEPKPYTGELNWSDQLHPFTD